jgi:hypothetical protein
MRIENSIYEHPRWKLIPSYEHITTVDLVKLIYLLRNHLDMSLKYL